MTLPRWISPALVTALLLVIILGRILIRGGGDPLVFAQLGDGFANGAPVGRPGYDGQFSYWMAMDPSPGAAAPHLDVPAYRYQRLLYPLLARALALGLPALIPWTLIAANLAAQIAGARLVEIWLVAEGASRWYALAYGLCAGLVVSVRLDLAEPVCLALVAAAFVAQQRGRVRLAALLLGLALFAKETALVFLAAELAWAALLRQWRLALPFALAAAPFVIFQFMLLAWFGSFGLGSGGWLATPFEWLPFMGLWRVAAISPRVYLLFLTVLGPLIIAPAVWGVWTAARRIWRGQAEPVVLALGANALLLVVAPSSTFRELLGIFRLATGLLLAVILYSSRYKSRRGLLIALFWLAALAVLFNS